MSVQKKLTVTIEKQPSGKFIAWAELDGKSIDSHEMDQRQTRDWLAKFGRKATREGYAVTERWI